MANAKANSLKAAFGTIERFLVEGDRETQQVAEISILETLQSESQK